MESSALPSHRVRRGAEAPLPPLQVHPRSQTATASSGISARVPPPLPHAPPSREPGRSLMNNDLVRPRSSLTVTVPGKEHRSRSGVWAALRLGRGQFIPVVVFNPLRLVSECFNVPNVDSSKCVIGGLCLLLQ